MVEALILAGLVTALGCAAFGARRAARGEAARRFRILGDCFDLIEDARLERDAAGYGVLRGRYDGFDVALRPFAEQLAFRRLPQLWLAATVRAGTDGATLDILRRPTGAEAFSPVEAAVRRFSTPVCWPSDTRVRGSQDAGWLVARLAVGFPDLFAAVETKHALVGPRGTRVVRRVAEGRRGAFLLFRDARFDETRVSRCDAEATLRAAVRVARLASPKQHADADDAIAA